MRRSFLLSYTRSGLYLHVGKRKQSFPLNLPGRLLLNHSFRQHHKVVSFSSSTLAGSTDDDDDDDDIVTSIDKIHITKSSFGKTGCTMSARSDHDANENDDPTILVDNLLERTKQLMDGYSQHYVAFSGGVDSSLVAALIHICSEQSNHNNDHHIHAILGLSPAVSNEQIQLAENVANHIGISLEQIHTTEGTDEVYIANTGNACYACKTHLYTCMESIINHASNATAAAASSSGSSVSSPSTTTTTTTTNTNFRLYNGTNADDLLDKTRSGLIAANEHNVQSPLQHITKQQVRIASKHLGLPNWNYAASPCLRSRLALGVNATPIELQRIEQAERYIRQQYNISIEDNLRVRLLSNNRAMIEIDPIYINTLSTSTETTTTKKQRNQNPASSFVSYFQNELGFASVGVREFRSGSVATTQPTKTTLA